MAFSAFVDQPQFSRLPTLLDEIKQGALRVPRFQRPFVWTDEQRLLLLDSIRQCMPIGSLLIWRTVRDIASYEALGPFVLAQPAAPGVRTYLLDGHQRLSTLFGALHAGTAALEAYEARWSIYYDLEKGEFRLPPLAGPPPVTWLPVSALLDAYRLYAHQKRLLAQNAVALSNRAENLANRFKDYLIPVVPIVTDDLDLVTETFRRINSKATPLGEVHMVGAAMWTPQFDFQARLAEVAEQIAAVGWGRAEPQLLLDVLKAARDLRLDRSDPEKIASQLRLHPELFADLPRHIQHAASFLLDRCGVAGPAALPHPLQLVILSEAARIHRVSLMGPVADELERWFWLTSLSDYLSPLAGHQIQETIEHIRGLVRGERGPGPPDLPSEVQPILEFDFTSPRSRALALLLVRHGPRDADGRPFRAAEALAALGDEAVPRILPLGSDADEEHLRGVENRWVADPRIVPRLREALRNPALPCWEEILQSHIIPREAGEALVQGDARGFLRHRRSALLSHVQRFFAGLLRAAPVAAVKPAPPEPPLVVGLSSMGVPLVVASGPRMEWIERAIVSAGLRTWRPGMMPPSMAVEALPRPTDAERWRISAGDVQWAADIAIAAEMEGEGEEALADVLCRLRAAALDPAGPVRLAIWSYAVDDIAHPDIAFSVGALEPPVGANWPEEAHQRFRERIAAPLRRIRQALGARPGAAPGIVDRWVLFHPKCHIGAAIYAGSVFHHQTGFWVDCDQVGETWDLNRQPARLHLPHLPIEVKSPGGILDEEVHLLISISRDVRDSYNAWLRQEGIRPRHRIHVTHRDGPGPAALRSTEAVDLADAVRQQLAPLRTVLDSPVRIFCAAPAAFAIALGRSLNAMGRIITMDLSKIYGTYFTSFDFTY